MQMPADANILLSIVNTKLRDEYPTLADFCEGEEAEQSELAARLAAIGYFYDESLNAFRPAR